MRRDAPGAFGGKALQGRRHRRTTEKTRRRHDAPIAEARGLQAGSVDRLIDRTQTGDRLFIGVFEEGGRQRLAVDGARISPHFC